MQKSSSAAWVLIGVGTQLTATVVAGFLLGFGVDTWLDTKPIFMLIFGCLGFVGGVLKAYKLLVRLG